MYAVIVNPLSSAQDYAAAFRAAGVAPAAVLTPGAERGTFAQTWHPERFDRVLFAADYADVAALADAVNALDPLCLVPGSEDGVELYEALNRLVLPGSGNLAELAAARRDKWAMAEALARAGVPRLRQLCTADPAAVARWLTEQRMTDRPIVLKPPKSGGTEDVHVVEPGGDWPAIFGRILGKLNATGIINDAVLVQEFAAGPELLVDTYSVDGRHGLVDVCRYTKFRRAHRIGIYDRVDFLPPDDPDISVVWPYVQRVLDAVGIRNGCGHTEIVLTADGPRLLEVAERPAGGAHQMISELATGDNHIKRTVAHRVRGQFRPGYRLERRVCGKLLSAPASGLWTNPGLFAGVTSLPTVHAANVPTAPVPVVETVDLITTAGWVVFAAQDAAAIEDDYRRVRDLERRIEVAA